MDFHILREPDRFLSLPLSFFLSRAGILIKMEREKENGRVGISAGSCEEINPLRSVIALTLRKRFAFPECSWAKSEINSFD